MDAHPRPDDHALHSGRLRIVTSDDVGRPLSAEHTRYDIVRPNNGAPEIREFGTGDIVTFTYSGPADSAGHANRSSQ